MENYSNSIPENIDTGVRYKYVNINLLLSLSFSSFSEVSKVQSWKSPLRNIFEPGGRSSSSNVASPRYGSSVTHEAGREAEGEKERGSER